MMDQFQLMQKVLQEIAKFGGFNDTTQMMMRISREQALGSRGAVFNDMLTGFNRRTQGNMLPANTDQQGLAFFTRPNLNLSYDNVMSIRTLSVLGSNLVNSYPRAIRRMLWPDGRRKDPTGGSPLFDDRQAFIPLLTNGLTSMSGWPDMMLHAYNSNEGLAKETWMMNDSIADINGALTLDCSFENTLGDPISLIFMSWILYIAGVYVGRLIPAGYSIRENEMDYNTRIYRFVLDWSGRYIQKWAACGAAFPTAISSGAPFNYSRETPYSDAVKSIQVPFACVGAMYNDPIVLYEFNCAAIMFNSDMVDGVREQQYQKIPVEERNLFNYRGYPYVNMDTYELEWWIDKDTYAAFKQGDLTKLSSGTVTTPITL